MKIEKKNITDNIVLLLFENQRDVASTFLRFQEHYESSEFRNKIFTLEEFKKWYSSVKGSFTYYSDWNGFNIPSSVLKPFYDGKFNPLSNKEKKILQLFKNSNKKFYIIATHKKDRDLEDTLKHEIAHGLFYTNKKYKQNVLKILSELDLEDFKQKLHSAGCYSSAVFRDEVHAYSIDLDEDYCKFVPRTLHGKLLKNYKLFLEKTNAHIPRF